MSNLSPRKDQQSKTGMLSPWTNAWGAVDTTTSTTTTIRDDEPLSNEEMNLLTEESLRIPTYRDTNQASVVPEILRAYDKYLKSKSDTFIGYPCNLMYNYAELYNFMSYSINNAGDPFVESNYGINSRQFECAVIEFFAKLWKAHPDNVWGYVTTGGTEGNLHGLLLARQVLPPNAILYTSQESHYSIFKAADYYRIPTKSIPTSSMGEMDCTVLEQELKANRNYPMILNVNIGTTVKGAVDDLDTILDVLQNRLKVPSHQFYIHCDGALFAMMVPFTSAGHDIISFRNKPIDSVTVSGHKMLGCPMPCGVTLARKQHVKQVEKRIDYLNSVDTTITGSRNGQAALFLWYALQKKGMNGIKADVDYCLATAKYLHQRLSNTGVICCLGSLSTTVVFEKPNDEDLIRKWHLAFEEDIAHVVIMPHVSRTKVDQFVDELVHCRREFGSPKPARKDSPLARLMLHAGIC